MQPASIHQIVKKTFNISQKSLTNIRPTTINVIILKGHTRNRKITRVLYLKHSMGTKKLINTSSSPPISYARHCDNFQQHNGNKKSDNTNTCCSVVTNTNTMFTKLRNYFSHIRETTSSTHRRNHSHRHHEKLTNCNSLTTTYNYISSNSNTSSNSNIHPSNMFNIISIIMLVLLALINTATSNPVFVDNPSLAQFQSGRNIRHLPCIVRKSGRSGVCMFAIDCIKQNGTHLGTCIDRFYFGSCCDIKEESYPEIADNSIDQNTISHHFTPESSTMPTSALFKLTTLSPPHHFVNISSSSNTLTQQDVTQMLNSVTQTFASTTLGDTSIPTTLITNSNSQKPNKATTTVKPSTHKHSQFVIRTTAKPTKIAAGSKPTHHNTTTKKKTTPTTTISNTTASTTTTTTRNPILTTTDAKLQQDELQLEITTTPTKLFTYQIVETTQFTPTEPTKVFDFVTTERIPAKTKKPHTTTSTTTTTTEAPRTTTTAKPKETTTTSITTTTTPRTTTTTPKPHTTRKPTTTKKPTTHKRTTVKPTRKPVTTTTATTDLKTHVNTTTSQTTESNTHTHSYDTTLQGNKTTHAPRPKPKPTATIVKVPKPITTTTTTTTTTVNSSIPTTSTTTPETTTESKKSEQTTTTTKKPTTLTTVATTQSSTTTTKPLTSTTTKATYKPIITSTHKPGLVTWTNIDGEPVVEPNKPINSDWIPVTTGEPLDTHNKVEEESSTDKTAYEESNVSVSSSVSAMMNNHTVIISPPQKPILVQEPTTSTSSTTSTATKEPTKPQSTATSTTTKPSHTPSTTAATTTTHKPISTSTLNTTEKPESSSTTASHQFTTEGIPTATATSPSGFTTEEFTTESFNQNSTQSPVSGLEGVDYRQVCGRRMFPEPRIVGGSNAAFGRWPWQISLRQWRTSTYLHKCGAALLNENWAITAAHCVDNVPPSDLLLRLGEYDLAEEEEPYGYQERRVQIVASHPQFDPRTFEYDLALLRFYEPVVFQPNIIPVCVPADDENFIGQTAFVTGWGRLYEDGPLPSVLQEVAVPVINNTICETMYRSAGYIEHIPHIFICAGWKKGGYDSCEGDSGGPMVLQRESDKRFQLGGVISWGIGCAEANQPGVYTRISEFRDWINQILQF